MSAAYLSPKHRHQLEEGSANAPEVTAERGVRTVTRGRDLPDGFSPRQRRRGPGTLFTVHRPNGETSHCFRPDRPDPDNPGRKYEQPSKYYGGPGNVLDVHPSCRHLIDRKGVPVVFVEGIKKADAITSVARAARVELLVVAISGVWNWLSDGAPIPDMLDIPVDGRRATVLFDSDMLGNPNVQDAARRLAEHLISRGAEVFITYLTDQADGSKTGADDFFAGGGTLSELRMLTRRYDPGDFERIRVSRDEKLRAGVEDLERRHAATRWTWPGADADEDIFLTLIEKAKRQGNVVSDGLRVVQAQGSLALEAKVSSRTAWKSLNRLEERGMIYRDNEGRKPDKAGAFVLRASVSHYGGRKDTEGKEAQELREGVPGDLHPRAPRLWASRPKWKPTKKMIREHRLGVRTWMPEPREGLKRLGKKRGHCLARIVVAGGALTLEELGEKMGIRPRDLVRRKTTDKGRDGLLIWLQEAGIVVIDGDTVSLTTDWLERLEEQREMGQEIEADELARRRYRKKSRAYHNRNEVPKSKPSAAGIESVRRSQETRDTRLREISRAEEERRPTGPPPGLGALISRVLDQLGRLRMGLLCEVAMEDNFNWRDVPEVVRRMGYRVERLPEYDNAEFVFARKVAA